MRSRVCFLLMALLALPSLAASAATAANPSVYPGANLQFEMTLTDKDFLPALKQFLPTIPGMIGEKMQAGQQGPQKPGTEQIAWTQLSSEQLAKDLIDAVGGLKKVSVGGYTLKSADGDKILQFYAQKIGLSSGWLQPLRFNDPKASFRLYVKPDLEEMFGLVVVPNQCIVVRTEGKIDMAKLAKAAAQFAPMAMQMGTQRIEETHPPAEPSDQGAQPAQPAQPAPAAPDGPKAPGSN